MSEAERLRRLSLRRARLAQEAAFERGVRDVAVAVRVAFLEYARASEARRLLEMRAAVERLACHQTKEDVA